MSLDFKKIFLEKEIFNSILGQEKAKKELKSALLMHRNIIIVGPPGVGKTTIAKNIANSLPDLEVNDCDFNCLPSNACCPFCKEKKPKTKILKGEERFIRIQGSPDLSAEDLLGDIDPTNALKFGPYSLKAFKPGKIFKANHGVLFFDEINRSPEKIQNALLQVLEEKNVTIGSHTIDFPAEFIFIATMNPDETSATERLSDVFLDRFDIVRMGYPETLEIEKNIVELKAKKLQIKFPPKLFDAFIKFIRNLRDHNDVLKKPSVRASIGVYERSQANAFLADRKSVAKEDVVFALKSVLHSRMELKPSAKYTHNIDEFVEKEIEEHFSSIADSADDNGGDGL